MKQNKPMTKELEKTTDTKNVTNFEKGNINILLLRFAIPAIIGMLCGGIQNIVNRIFVGKAVGSLALAGVQIGFPVMTIFMAISMLIGIGSMSLISIRMGQKRKDDAERILGQAVLLSFLVPIVVCTIFQIFLDDILMLIGATENVLPYAHDYFRVFLWGMVFFQPSASINNIIRAQGAPNVAMGTQILACVINIVLNYFFVFHFGWGVQGAAWGILLGNFFSLFWIFGFFMTKNAYLRIRFKYLRIYPKILKTICILGVTPFLMQLANSAQQLIMNKSLVNLGGDAALSALSIVMSLGSIMLLPMIGFSQGGQPIMGYNYGAGNYERIRGTILRAILYATILACAVYVFVEFETPFLVDIFISNEPEVRALAIHAARLYFLTTPFVGVGIVGVSLFQACGKAVRATLLSLSRQVLYFIPCLIIMPLFMGIDGCWIAACVSDALAGITVAITCFFGLRSIKREMKDKGVGNLVA